MNNMRFSLVTNVSLFDAVRIATVLPHWIRTFGSYLNELVIVLDTVPPSGRIASQHAQEKQVPEMMALLNELTALNPEIIRWVSLPSVENLRPFTRDWFRSGHPLRCQCGTPIAAFIYAISCAKSEFVLKTDCDMLFRVGPWLPTAIQDLADLKYHVVEPPRSGIEDTIGLACSSRAMMLRPKCFRNLVLPFNAHSLDLLRRIHRRLNSRPTWLALEQMLEIEKREKRIRHLVYSAQGDGALHVATHADMLKALQLNLVQRYEGGEFPYLQRLADSFIPSAWEKE